MIRRRGDADINDNGRLLLPQRTVHHEHFLLAQRCAQVHLVQRFLGQRSLIDFSIVAVDLSCSVLDVRVKRGAELPTDHHLQV